MPEHYVARNPQTAWRVYDGEAVILLAQDSTLNTLNSVGTLIWEVSDGKTPVSAIVARICEEFDVEPIDGPGAIDTSRCVQIVRSIVRPRAL